MHTLTPALSNAPRMPNRSELPNLALIPCLVSPPIHYTLPDEAVAATVVKEQWTRHILSTTYSPPLSPTHRSSHSPAAVLLSVDSSDNAYQQGGLVRVPARANFYRHAVARAHAHAHTHGSRGYGRGVAASN